MLTFLFLAPVLLPLLWVSNFYTRLFQKGVTPETELTKAGIAAGLLCLSLWLGYSEWTAQGIAKTSPALFALVFLPVIAFLALWGLLWLPHLFMVRRFGPQGPLDIFPSIWNLGKIAVAIVVAPLIPISLWEGLAVPLPASWDAFTLNAQGYLQVYGCVLAWIVVGWFIVTGTTRFLLVVLNYLPRLGSRGPKVLKDPRGNAGWFSAGDAVEAMRGRGTRTKLDDRKF